METDPNLYNKFVDYLTRNEILNESVSIPEVASKLVDMALGVEAIQEDHNSLIVSMKEYFDSIPQYEAITKEDEMDIYKAAQSLEPVCVSNSLHIYEEQFLIGTDTYRFLYEISGQSGIPIIEKLKTK